MDYLKTLSIIQLWNEFYNVRIIFIGVIEFSVINWKLQKLLTYLVRLNVKNLFTVLKTFFPLEVFRNFNGVKLPR